MKQMSSFSELYSHPNKYLEDHLKNVKEISLSYIDEIPIKDIPLTKEQLKKLTQIITLSHDIGKATTYFQEYLLKGEEKGGKETRHSLLSSFIAYYITQKVFSKENIDENLKALIPIFSFLAVKRHHGDFTDILSEIIILDEEKELLKKQVESIDDIKFNNLINNLDEPDFKEISKEKLFELIEKIPQDLKKYRIKIRTLKNYKSIDFYIFNNLLFSFLIDGDKTEVTVGKNKRKDIEIPHIIIDNYKKTLKIEKRPINELREKAYQEVINKNINLEEKIYSLNLPTGLGKTFTSVAFALKLREMIRKKEGYTPRIIYSLPFLSIIEQNAEIIEKVLKNHYKDIDTTILLKHHHLSDIYYKIDDKEVEPDEAKILIEGWNSEIIITTFVQLFHTLISNKNSTLRKFHRICGSIIILDEIQSIPTKYWLLLREIFTNLVEKYNCFIIFSTATQPLIFKPEEMVPLVQPEDYFIKLNRTILKPNINERQSLEEFLDNIKIEDNKSYMFILNTIRSAQNFYNLLKEKLKEEIIYLSSHITPKERLERINKIKNKEARIIVTTQLVEAGVDIDLDVVYRDIAPLDSINQSAGRCNRNWLKDKGEVYIYSLKDDRREYSSYIYDKILLDITKDVLIDREYIPEIDFINFINDYFYEINERKSQDVSKNLLEAIYSLRYAGWAENEEDKNIGIEDFKLIEDDLPKMDVFVELNEEAKYLWSKYCELKEIKDIFERRIEFQKIKADFYKYVISIPIKSENIPPIVHGFGYVSKDNLQEFYDPITGYKTKSEIIIW